MKHAPLLPILLLLLTGTTHAQDTAASPVMPAAVTPAAVTPAPVTLAAGTPLAVVLTRPLTSGRDKAGQVVPFAVAEAVTHNGVVLIPAATPAFGTVAQSRGGGAFGRPGTLRVTCDYVLMPSGVRVPVRARQAEDAAGRSNGGAAGVTGTAVGLAVGSVAYAGQNFSTNFLSTHNNSGTPITAGLAAGLASGLLVGSFFHGGSVTLPAGHPVAVVVTRDTALPAALR